METHTNNITANKYGGTSAINRIDSESLEKASSYYQAKEDKFQLTKNKIINLLRDEKATLGIVKQLFQTIENELLYTTII